MDHPVDESAKDGQEKEDQYMELADADKTLEEQKQQADEVRLREEALKTAPRLVDLSGQRPTPLAVPGASSSSCSPGFWCFYCVCGCGCSRFSLCFWCGVWDPKL